MTAGSILLPVARADSEVAVLLSNGNGTFKAAKAYTVPAGVDQVALGDFNGDGKLDVAVTNWWNL